MSATRHVDGLHFVTRRRRSSLLLSLSLLVRALHKTIGAGSLSLSLSPPPPLSPSLSLSPLVHTIIMGLSRAALILIFILSLSSPLPSLSTPSHFSFPAIKSLCVDYFCNMWSLFSRSTDPILITPRNLFLLVNLIILFLFISLHLQQHAPAAAGKRLSRKKRQQHKEKLIMNDKQAAPLQGSSLAYDLTGSEAAAMEKEALISAAEELPENHHTEGSLLAEAAPMPATADRASLDQTSPAVDSGCINGSDTEQIVMEEDGQLRLIGGTTGDTNGSDTEKSESERLRLIEPRNGSDAEKIVLEEDGQLRLVEATNGSDADKIVLEEDGRLRLIDRPQLPSSGVTRRRPRKSLSTGDKNYHNADNYDPNNNLTYDTHSLHNKGDEDIHSLNYDTQSLNKVDYDIHSLNNNDTNSLNHNHSNLNNELNNGTDIIDCSLTNNHSTNKSSARPRTSSRPIKVKKSDSLDATWKAINNNKGSANRDQKNLIRQSSRQDFKPPISRGLMRASNNNSKVRREPSISQDELNAKVESFIANFNEQIRIQRQQSLLSYMQMVDRGA